MHAGSAAEREERETARIEPALHRGLVQKVEEEAVRKLVHRRRRLDQLEAERLGDLLLEEASRLRDVELGATSQEVPGVEVAEDRVDVGDRRLGPAVCVADGAGIRPGAPRADARRTGAFVDGDDAPAREPERDDVHLRERVVVAEDERFTLVLDQPLADRADLEGRASHVRGDDVSQAELLPEALRADEAADGARLDHPDRARRGLVHRQQPTVGLSHEQLAGEAVLRQLRPQVVEVPVDDRPESRVERRRRRPLVLADDRRDLVREREERVRGDPLHDLPDLALGGRVGERPERADTDRVHLFGHERLHRRGDVVFVRRRLHVAIRVGPLLDPDDQRALDDRRRLVRIDGVALLVLGQPRPAAVAASHREECVLEAPRRDHAGARKRAVDHCVLGDGRGVQEESCSREQRSCFGVEQLGGDVERVEDPRGEVRAASKRPCPA